MRGRAAAVVGVAVLVAAGCVLAGRWQWTRHADRSAEVARVAAHYDAAPVPAEDLLAPDGSEAVDVADLAWRPVTLVGRYVGTALLRNRPTSGTPAVHALGLLEVEGGRLDGAVVVLDRGWLPAAEADGADARGPAPPSGTVTVVARLRPAEQPSGRDAPAGQVQRIVPDEVAAAAGTDGHVLGGVYGAVATEDGAPPAGVQPLPRPEADLGPHLSYAFQWWVFAAGALVGAVVLLRRDAAEARPGTSGSGRTSGPRRRRAPTAEDEEDALLDAAERDAAERDAAERRAGRVSPS
ncbi:MAG: SURF1 family protein [Actinomycetales bacterium]|nr:SURF1 family protein [Actinomycetales bacterium]